MRVFVAGSTGAVGKRLVPLLLESGHEVVALSRTARKARELEALGAKVTLADALNKEAVGAKPPHKVPVWLGKLGIGDGGVSMMTRIRGGSNAKAKRELGWQPIYPTWQRGFAEGL